MSKSYYSIEDEIRDALFSLGIESEPPNCDDSAWTFKQIAILPERDRAKFAAFIGELHTWLGAKQ